MRHEQLAHAPGDSPQQLDAEALRLRCTLESERFYRGQPHDTRFAYELFRRALVERSDLAWEHLYVLYRPLIESWVRRSGAFASSGETADYFVAPAFLRFWQALTPERFADFPTLASLLAYLQLCASCVVIDSVRAQSWSEMLPEEAIPHGHAAHHAPDEEALARIGRQEFWRFINAQLSGEVERIVVHDSFVLGMKPGDILDRHPALFATVTDVYNVKRNILGRLSRNQDLRSMIGL